MKPAVRRVLVSKLFYIPVAVPLFYTILGFLIIPFTIRWYIPKLAQEQFKCKATIGEVRINPYLLSLEVKDFGLKGPDGTPIAGFDRFSFDLATGSSITNWAALFQSLRLEKPVINLVIEQDGTLNLARLAPKSSEQKLPEPQDASKSKPVRLILSSLELTGGEVNITDKRQATPAALNFQDLNIDLKSLSTFVNRNGTYSLAAKTKDGESVEWHGDISLAPFQSTGKVIFKDIRTATLWEFLQNGLDLDSPGGTLTISTDYRIETGSAPLQAVLENLKVDISGVDLKLAGTGEPFLQLGKFGFDCVKIDLAKAADAPFKATVGNAKGELSGVALKAIDAGTPVCRLGKFSFDCAGIDLAAKTIQVNKLLLDGGRLDLRLDEAGVSNLERIVRRVTAQREGANGKEKPDERKAPEQEAKDSPPEAPWKVNFDDIEVKELAFGLEDLSKVSPLSAAIESISVSSKANVETGAKPTVSVREIATELKGLHFGARGAPRPIFEARKLAIEGGEVDLGARSLTVSRVALNDGRVDVGMDRDDRLNFEQLLTMKAGPPDGAKPAAAGEAPWKFLVKTFELGDIRSSFSDEKVLPDKELYALKNIAVRVTGIDGKSPMNFEAGFAVEQGGKVNLSGKIDPASQSVEARVNVAGLALAPIDPYLDPFITLTLQSANLSMQGDVRYGVPNAKSKISYEGSFGIDKLSLNQPGSKETFLGWQSMQIPQLKLALEPNSLQIPEIRVSHPVGTLMIAEDKTVNLAKVVKEQPAKTAPPAPRSSSKAPVKKAAKESPASSAAPQKQSGEPFPFNIGKIRINDGNVVFADFSLKPQFMARIHQLKGTVSKLSSEKNVMSAVQLDGLVDRYGLAKVTGSLDLGNFKRSCDINVIFRNVEMTSISPYSGKFAGRMIKSGKLSMDLKYRIQDSKLEGDNKVIVDNLVLGEKVESPDAVNLPLDLAVALLSDANGRIDLGLPVTGDLSDPQFAIWPLVWKAFGNLITRAVTAPFRALGSLIGGGTEKIDAVEFEPGQAVLLPPEKEKIKKVAETLGKKPQLKVVLRGRYSPEIDGRELKELNVCRTVVIRKGVRLGPGEDPGPLDFDDSGTRGALEKMYTERFGKPALEELDRAAKEGKIEPRVQEEPKEKKSKKGSVFSRALRSVKFYKIVPGAKSPEQSQILAGELYFRLVESDPLKDDVLVQLGTERATAISRELQDANAIPADRIATQDPEPLADDAGLAAGLSLDVMAAAL